jgi:hypothetical protein
MIAFATKDLDFGDLPTWISAIGSLLALFVLWRTLKLTSNQLSLQEGQIKELQDAERTRQEREHASKISIWPEPSLKNPVVHLINTSESPVTNVVLTAKRNDSASLEPVFGGDQMTYGFLVLPKGEFTQTLPESTFDLSAGVTVYFTDQSGAIWRRDVRGKLKKTTSLPKVDRWLDKPAG